MSTSADMTPRQCSDLAKRLAGSQGFSACGVCAADPIERRDYVLDWLRAGYHGQMEYLQRNIDVRLDPRQLLPGARSVIVVGWLYRVAETAEGLPAGPVANGPAHVRDSTDADSAAAAPESKAASQPPHAIGSSTPANDPGAAPTGRIARYAWGRDYHRVIRKRLQRLVDQLRLAIPAPFETRICVDTAPLLERELAQRAGLGWIGNNCLVLSRELGSYFCLGAVLTTLDLALDEPGVDSCGTCRRCVEACPTGALVAPKQMDPRRCVSYQTIERRDKTSEADDLNLAGQVFGCDICQQVCPYNGPRAPVSTDPDAQPHWPAGQISVEHVLSWTESDWDSATRGRALRRATVEMWQRNAQILLRLWE